MSTIPDSHLDLLSGSIGAFATVGPDGRPQVTAITARLLDDGRIHTSINTARQKFRNLSAKPVATFLVIDATNPWRTIEVRGDVELLPDQDKSWSREFLGDAIDIDAIDGTAARVHLILTPRKTNVHG
jgi:PPOX class probable F420-dependent enzyme